MARATNQRLYIAIIVILALVLLPSIYTASYQTQGNKSIQVDNETWTPNTGSYVELSENDDESYALDNETVYNNSKLVEETDNYSFSRNNISIKALSGGELDGTSSANITYTAKRPYQSTKAIHSTLTIIVNNVTWVILLVVGAAALGMFARLAP